ncbi:hypothetical protein SPV1_03818 [Mariprofundus ferrooxydans PV-1]|uniref:Uncharacterized protein n=1 Tax=Mariprofundus ferrooxydans PV-1 TaxID=314345 RepID=Q0F3M7_9PROT|nr:hypothetical protein SPV1_03818 [Mariprofundus ferrooxydans PV-1]
MHYFNIRMGSSAILMFYYGSSNWQAGVAAGMSVQPKIRSAGIQH